jgi:hypothetical protein
MVGFGENLTHAALIARRRYGQILRVSMPIADKVEPKWMARHYLALFGPAIRMIAKSGAPIGAARSRGLLDSNLWKIKSRKQLPTSLSMPPARLTVPREVPQHRRG